MTQRLDGGLVLPIAIAAGRYPLSIALDDRIRAAADAPARYGRKAHPVFAFVAALGGMGVSVADLCRMIGSRVEDGPVLATCTIDQARAMEVDRSYDVEGAVEAIVRKPSRRFGAADHVGIGLCVRSGGEVFSHLRLAWVMPRPVDGGLRGDVAERRLDAVPNPDARGGGGGLHWRLDAVPGAAMAHWCEALGDDNPIHLDRAAAERLGFGPNRVNPGPANLAYLMNMLLDAGAGEGAAVWGGGAMRVEARFLANLVEGDAAVAEGSRLDDGGIETLLRRGDGLPVVAARFVPGGAA